MLHLCERQLQLCTCHAIRWPEKDKECGLSPGGVWLTDLILQFQSWNIPLFVPFFWRIRPYKLQTFSVFKFATCKGSITYFMDPRSWIHVKAQREAWRVYIYAGLLTQRLPLQVLLQMWTKHPLATHINLHLLTYVYPLPTAHLGLLRIHRAALVS